MRDIPVFTTEYGVASLSLRQIQTRGEAFIRVQTAQEGCTEQLIAECARFCRGAGAEKVYASEGNGEPAYAVLQMRGNVQIDTNELEHIFPVTSQTVARWREIYNHAMSGVDHAKYLSGFDEEKILSSGGAYFVHRNGEILGIGWLEDQSLLAIATCKPGLGYRVMQTLLSVLPEESVTLEVASTNRKAIRLYERMGFIKIAELDKWYRIS